MKNLVVLCFLIITCQISSAQLLIQAVGSTDVCYPNQVTLEVVSPQAGYDYSWFIGGYGCPSGPSAPYNIGTTLQALITGEFYCIGSPIGGGSPLISNPITVRNLPGMPGSIYMPAPGLYVGNTTCVSSVSLCIPAIYYQNWPGTIIRWYKNNVLINGATSGSYNANSSGYYKYSITTSCLAWSDSTLVTISPTAMISAAGSTTVCQGGSVMLNANSGSGVTYQWKNNTIPISGAINQSYSATTSGNYTVSVSNSCGTVTSVPIQVTVNPLPTTAIAHNTSLTFCSGGNVVLNAPVNANYSYQWRKNGVNISGATSQSYTATSNGNYKVTVTNNLTGCSKLTATPTVVTVNALPSANVTPQGPLSFCAGGSVVLQANTGAGLTYKWKKNGNYISGVTVTNYTAASAGTYKVEVKNTNACSKLSSGIVVTVPCRDEQLFSTTSHDIQATLYPNPYAESFTLYIKFVNDRSRPVINEFYQVIIKDVLGRTVSTEMKVAGGKEIQLGNELPSGFYLVEIVSGEKRKMMRIEKL